MWFGLCLFGNPSTFSLLFHLGVNYSDLVVGGVRDNDMQKCESHW